VTEFAAARAHMIDCQLRPSEVNDERVIAAIDAVARELFVPKAKRSFAYVDEDIAVSDSRYLMEPMVFARLLVAANIQSDELVLDVACATGYSTAVISHLADAVVGLEEDEAFITSAEKRLGELEVMNAAIVKGDPKAGVAKQGPFDVIMIEGAVSEVPDALIKQLKDGGRLLCVKMHRGVGRAHIVTMNSDIPAARDLFDANIPMLPGFEAKESFQF